MKYKVTVSRQEHRSHTFTVDAESEIEAEMGAMEAANDHNFEDSPCQSAYEEITGVKVLRPVVKGILRDNGKMCFENQFLDRSAPASWQNFNKVSKDLYFVDGVKCALFSFNVAGQAQNIYCLVDSTTI